MTIESSNEQQRLLRSYKYGPQGLKLVNYLCNVPVRKAHLIKLQLTHQ